MSSTWSARWAWIRLRGSTIVWELVCLLMYERTRSLERAFSCSDEHKRKKIRVYSYHLHFRTFYQSEQRNPFPGCNFYIFFLLSSHIAIASNVWRQCSVLRRDICVTDPNTKYPVPSETGADVAVREFCFLFKLIIDRLAASKMHTHGTPSLKAFLIFLDWN